MYSTWVFSAFVYGPVIFLCGFVFSAFDQGFYKSGEYKKYKAPWSPPNWLFGIAWTILYAILCASFVLVIEDVTIDQRTRTEMIILFVIHIILNYLWTPIFVSGRAQGVIDLVICIETIAWFFALGVTQNTQSYSYIGAWLIVPYIAWLLYALSLNAYFTVAEYFDWRNSEGDGTFKPVSKEDLDNNNQSYGVFN